MKQSATWEPGEAGENTTRLIPTNNTELQLLIAAIRYELARAGHINCHIEADSHQDGWFDMAWAHSFYSPKGVFSKPLTGRICMTTGHGGERLVAVWTVNQCDDAHGRVASKQTNTLPHLPVLAPRFYT